ncbi:alpha-amylase family glycosyl hydrolase [Sulfurirhabdus autotrophica]|uniref:Alpha-amylase n=1 Tax=Sulfurirhabdus autotrophica TaxID=1706046 RepID=A0A4R3YHW1_9PROT|nr:alpha-amylase family glycosyl hydrolase [Sulfurirhabdus autotrophica]TCV90868.1 glycosidase [Sulfurirhabdus autotrophica]
MATALHSVSGLDFRPVSHLHPSPRDWRDQFIYFLLVDRFDNNVAGLQPFKPGITPTGRDPEKGHRFQGGNLKGITRRLDYIKGLGCTTIWLSPILKNRPDLSDTYHGYGIQDFMHVDPRFGTLQDLQELTAEAHSREMYVILDVVLNHTGDVWQYPDDNPYYFYEDQTFPFGGWREANPIPEFQDDDAIWPVELQTPDAFKRRGQIRDWNDPVEARDGDFLSLKELDLPRPTVLDTLIKIYKYWIATADIDGFRIDTVKHMESSATAIFCNAMREYAKRIGKYNFFLYGEIVADDATIQKYIGRNSRIEGTNERFPALDAALDFPLYFLLEDVIKGFASPAFLRNRYEEFYDLYADHGEAGRYFVTFVDNHDQMARPYRRFMYNNPYQRQAVLAIGYLLTSQGVPCIYYGTEQGFDGAGSDDSYVRECMFGGSWGAFNTTGGHFFNPDHPIYKAIRIIARIRSKEPALRYGRQYFREISENGLDFAQPMDGHCTLAYSRILDTEEVLVCLNLDNVPRSDYITVDVKLSGKGRMMGDMMHGGKVKIQEMNNRAYVQVMLPAHGMAILKCE